MEQISDIISYIDCLSRHFLATPVSFFHENDVWLTFEAQSEYVFVAHLTVPGSQSRFWKIRHVSGFDFDGSLAKQTLTLLIEGLVLVCTFRPHQNLKVVKLSEQEAICLSNQSCFPSFNAQTLDSFFLKEVRTKPNVLLFSSKVYYASVLSAEQLRTVIANYFTVSPTNVIRCTDCQQNIRIDTFFVMIPSPINEQILSFIVDFNNSLMTSDAFKDSLQSTISGLVSWFADEFSYSEYELHSRSSFFTSFQLKKRRQQPKSKTFILTLLIKIKTVSNNKPVSWEIFFSNNTLKMHFINVVQQHILNYKDETNSCFLDTEYMAKGRKIFDKDIDEIVRLVMNINAQPGFDIVQEELGNCFDLSVCQTATKIDLAQLTKQRILVNLLKLDKVNDN